jgi:small-conductance mechanosensitive channel
MKIFPKIAEMTVILITAVALLAPVMGLAQGVDPGHEIGRAVAQAINEPPMNITAISIMGILGVFVAPAILAITIVALAYWHRDRKEQRNHETIRQMIEKGMEIPEHLSFGERPMEGSVLLRRGLTMIGTGVGLIIFFFLMGMADIAGVGAIPLFIGLAYLLVRRLEKKKVAAAG